MLNNLAPKMRVLAAGTLAALLLTACGPEIATPEPTVTPTAEATSTATAEPAATMAPVTTPSPSPLQADTPEPSPSPTVEAQTPIPTVNVGDLEWTQVGITGTRLTDLALMSAGGTNLVLAAAPDGVWRASADYTDWQELNVPAAEDGEASGCRRPA